MAPPPVVPENRPSLPRRILNLFLGLVVLGMLAWSALFFAFAPELPDTSRIWQQERSPGIVVLAADGSELARRGGLKGGPVGYQHFPQHLVDAVIATEDRRFFSHFGMDVIGLARAMWRNAMAGRVVEGGSTITQQLAKNLYLSSERSLNRKIQEMFLAVWLETKLTKHEILTIYLNRVYFGAGAYGVSAAARTYFRKPVGRLSLAEAAMLAGLLKAPSKLAPTNNLKAARGRAAVVLNNMVAAGYLDEAAARRATDNPARAVSSQRAGTGRYFVDWVLSGLPDSLRSTDRDLVIATTLEPAVQAAAARAIARTLDRASSNRVAQAALVSLGRDGRVRAMIGGRDYRASSYNRATQARRQPGSAFKPVVFAAALDTGLRPNSRLDDSKITIDGWTPVNHDGRYNGRISMARALARSVNPAVVRLQEKIGREAVIAMARDLGVRSKLKAHPSLALGASEVGVLELTGAFLPFATGGVAARPYGIVEVRTNTGRVLFKGRSERRRVLKRRAADDMADMLRGAVRDGTGRRAAIKGVQVGGKTGTSQDNRDAWFIGIAGETATGVWFGNDDGRPMRNVTGGGFPAIAWRDFMVKAMTAAPAAVASKQRMPETRDEPAEDAADMFERLADAVLDGLNLSEEKEAIDKETRETAKGVFRWFMEKASEDSDSNANTGVEGPREDFGQ